MRRIKHRSSRRVALPQDSDFDHEINLVDHSAPPPRRSSSAEGPSTHSISATATATATASSDAASTPSVGPSAKSRTRSIPPHHLKCPPKRAQTAPSCPSVHMQQPAPQPELVGLRLSKHARARARNGDSVPDHEPGSAVDVLYENQRGGFMCGIALFSSKALGQLDPPAWTNAANKPSPTSIETAQVPDPSWEWAWPEWRIRHDEAVGEDGWVYSFMFSNKFKWHKPRWWNSFVRRRVWIRKRVKRPDADMALTDDPFGPNPDYFSIRASSDAGLEPRVLSSHDNVSTTTDVLKIEDTETLVQVLRKARIDREKIEAVEKYLEHAKDDLARLQDEMHDIMSLFVFQASRRLLLSRLTDLHEETMAREKSEGSESLLRRAENLSAAVKHADEEVRRLEYWSDVKAMAEGGSKGAVSQSAGWDESWQGLDQSGPSAPKSA